MKKNIFNLITVGVLFTLLFAACKPDNSYIASYQTTNSGTSTYLKVIDASPYFRNSFGGAPDSFNIYLNNQKFNFQYLTFGVLYPAASTNYGYAAIPSGLQQMRFSVNGKVNVDSLTFATFTTTLLQGTYYTLLITDSMTSVNPASQMLLVDTLNPVLQGYYNVRFANAVLQDSAITTTGNKTVDIFSYSRNAAIWRNIAPGAVTSFQALNTNIGVADTLYVTRAAAASTTPLTSRVVLAKLAITPLNRNYTIYYNGDGTLTTGTKARKLSIYVNQ